MPDSHEHAARRDRLKGYALAATAALFWATGGLAAKWLFSPLDAITATWPFPPPGIDADPVTLAGARAVTAAIILFAYVLARRPDRLKILPRNLPFLAFFGIAGLAAVHVTYFQAISYTNVATAILLEYLAPVLVMLFSVAFLNERMTVALPVGVALSITGCALVVGAFGGQGLAISPQGLAWGLASAVFFALYSLLGKYGSRFSPWTLLTYGLLFAAVFWIVYMHGLKEISLLMSSVAGLGTVLYLAVFATIVPFGAFLKALHYIDATKAVVTSTLEPVIAGIVAYLLFGESFGPMQLLGGAMVIAAIVVVQRPYASLEAIPPAT
jgi:drug/metabolite transporter (DMT)-like permease